MTPIDRYSRARRFSALGDAGQSSIEGSRVAVFGCGALGSMISERLVRSGVGTVRIIDRDWVELSNLQRQTLFTESDAEAAEPKAIAAAASLRHINSTITIEARVEDISYRNIAELAADVDLIMDGTDNFETRFLINDFCLSTGLPWIHGGVLGAAGQVMSIVPGKTACLRCLIPDIPSRESMPTCDSAGVMAPAVGVIASLQAAEALKILSGRSDAICTDLMVIDTWHTTLRQISISSGPEDRAACPACGLKRFDFLTGSQHSATTILCGKNAVQIDPPAGAPPPNLNELAARLRLLGPVQLNMFLLRLNMGEHRITLFRDGRAIIDGTTDPSAARSILTKGLGG
ncbi:MAG: ThiF family adenylyltransferase [Pirellulales bacterium]